MTTLRNPDCRDGKHRACAGNGWDETADQAAPCPCSCHVLDPAFKLVDEMSAGIPEALAALPTTHAMQAKHLSGASIGKLVQYSDSRSLVTNEHQWSPAFTLDAVYHSGYEHTVYDTDGNEWDLPPDSWVRVTQATP